MTRCGGEGGEGGGSRGGGGNTERAGEIEEVMRQQRRDGGVRHVVKARRRLCKWGLLMIAVALVSSESGITSHTDRWIDGQTDGGTDGLRMECPIKEAAASRSSLLL